MKQTKIYLSGAISGLEKSVYETNFWNATVDVLKMKLCSYLDIINPLDIKPLFGIHLWFFFMCSDLFYLIGCTHVAFQKNCIYSRGARIEMIVAILFNKKIIML